MTTMPLARRLLNSRARMGSLLHKTATTTKAPVVRTLFSTRMPPEQLDTIEKARQQAMQKQSPLEQRASGVPARVEKLPQQPTTTITWHHAAAANGEWRAMGFVNTKSREQEERQPLSCR